MTRIRNRIPIPLSYQLVAGLVILIITAALAIAIAAIWSTRVQLDRQAWGRVDNAITTTETEFDNLRTNLQNLAILTAQRPTLQQLVANNDPDALSSYLEVLRQGAKLDAMFLCKNSTLIILVGEALSEQVCSNPRDTHETLTFYDNLSDSPAVWVLAGWPLMEDTRIDVLVGERLDQSVFQSLSAQFGIGYALLNADRLLAASLPFQQDAWRNQVNQEQETTGTIQAGFFTLENVPYYAKRVPLTPNSELVIALPVTEIVAGQRWLSIVLAIVSILAVLLCGSGGIILARRISYPLDRLRASALALRQGDLEKPIRTTSSVLEVAQVTYALEDARVALRHSLSQRQQEKAWSNHLLEAVVEGIITLDRQGRITFFSQGAEKITGYSKDQVLFKSIDELFILQTGIEKFSQRLPLPGGNQEKLVVQLRRPGLGESTHIGHVLTLSITTARLIPSEVGHAQLVLVLRDVTNEEAIRRLLGDFLANITHEFRTPLTAQAVSIELLLDQLDDLSQNELRELLEAQHLGVLGLQTLIDNLLEGASIEAGHFRVTPHPTQLAEVVSVVARTLQPLLEKHNLNLDIELPPDLPPILADPRRTSQVITNLLSNAIKWSPQGGMIGLSAKVENIYLRVMVSDQGPGITAEQIKTLFTWQPNIQAKSERADFGAGLGLSVVRAIVEAQGGRVGVETGIEQGSTFWFTIPILAESSQTPLPGIPNP